MIRKCEVCGIEEECWKWRNKWRCKDCLKKTNCYDKLSMITENFCIKNKEQNRAKQKDFFEIGEGYIG